MNLMEEDGSSRFRISKRQQVTDWEAIQLTDAQQIYAATDAWVCHQIYRKLVNGNINPLPGLTSGGNEL